MFSLLKSCIDVPRRKRKQREVPGHGGGDVSLSVSARLPSEATTGPNFPASALNNTTSNPSLPAGSFTNKSSSPPAGASSNPVAGNPSVHAGTFNGAHHFTIYKPTMIDGNNANEGQVMRLLLGNIIVGAEFDSSDHRPSCHPETRLDKTHNIQSWMYNPIRKYKILWLHGPAGVGKSAILQTIAETASGAATSILGATLFFSRPNSRNDLKCVFITIAYRLAVRYPVYRQYIVRLLTIDPQLVGKSLAEQFKTSIVQPFGIEQLLAEDHDTVLVLLDGLGECNGEEAQCEIILLIGRFVLQYPTSPLIWLIASRPEPHIQDAFSKGELQRAYGEMRVLVDSDQGRRDVEMYLRDKFADIRKKYRRSIPSSLQQWPSESDLSTIATRSSGLFIFPSTLIRFIGDTAYAGPISRLKIVLDVIESTSSSDGGHSLFETLDALYTRILSEVPRDVISTTLRLLVLYIADLAGRNFVESCNRLGLTQGGAYGALQRLHSVLDVPEPQDAWIEKLRAFHASFYDYLLSPSRSGPFCVVVPEVIQYPYLRWIGILLKSHSVETSDIDATRVRLPWPIDNEEDRLDAQRGIFRWALNYLIRASDTLVNDFIQDEFSRLAAFFQDLDFGKVISNDPLITVMCAESVFAANLERLGVLKTVPLQSFNFNDIRFDRHLTIVWYGERGTSLRLGWVTDGLTDGLGVPLARRRILRNVSWIVKAEDPLAWRTCMHLASQTGRMTLRKTWPLGQIWPLLTPSQF
ncbi:hypothetical protein P691DRAFT_765649 [Macrolepiota fuliginosa MF-IS2]|uniref:Nephrocystin 3-like N-terminal domain-containing protein n=1 Tax=Macrolepiota fuliginosa MF-IS2 TaxID=1400762 RepID=A0A9P5X367_9AGAR|nr:hypothetical protein P691DRAFT_765649 [Macrolepiota fuliginosa MF-IS2]